MSDRETHPFAFGFIAGLWFLFGVFTVLALACAGSVHHVASRRPYEVRSHFAVLVNSTCITDKGGTIRFGSGVVVGPRRVLSAWHVVGCKPSELGLYKMTDVWGVARLARIVRLWPERDIALLELVDPDAAFLYGDVAIAKANQRTYACSSVIVPEHEANCGRLLETHDTVCPKNVWCHNVSFDAKAIPGNSGGAIYDEDGALIGLVTGVTTDQKTMYGTLLAPIQNEITR